MHITDSLFLALFVGAAGALPAQTTPSFTSPSGYTSKNVGGIATEWGLNFFEGRCQTVERNMPQGAPLILTRLSYRAAADFAYGATNRIGTTWTNVSLTLADAASTITSTFSSNYRSPGSLVFNAKLTLPDLSLGTTKPVWGDVGSIPLQAYTYSGKYSLLLDWTAVGGKFNNGYTDATGGGRFFDGFGDHEFMLLEADSPTAPGSQYLPSPPTKNGCTDSQQTAIDADAHAYASGRIYSSSYPDTGLAGRLAVLALEGRHGQPSGVHIGLLSLGGSDTGVSIGKCYRLYANPATSMMTSAANSNAAGTSTHLTGGSSMFYNRNWKGVSIYWQFAFADSRTGVLGLSKATKIVLPRKPGTLGTSAGLAIFRYKYQGQWVPSDATTGRTIVDHHANAIEGWNIK